jgi:hypothetical protein
MSDSVALYRLAHRLPLVRGLTHTETPYFTGSVVENRLGLQIFRLIGKYLSWSFRGRYTTADIEDYVRKIEMDGVLVLPDFLGQQEFLQIKEEFERVQSKCEFSGFRSVDNGSLKVARYPIADCDEDFKYTRQYLQNNPLVHRIVSATIRRPINSMPPTSLNVYRRGCDEASDNDLENILHADLHTPTAKAFFYLNDVDQSNGAFVYAKGSQRLSLNRIFHEYNISVRTAKLRRGDKDIPASLLAKRGPHVRNIIAEKYSRKLHLVESHLCGKANTLIIANNMGFHRRGEFTSERPRKTILVNFRHLEHPF